MHSSQPTKLADPAAGHPAIIRFRALFESELDSGHVSTIESWLQLVSETHRAGLFLELLDAELAFHRKKGVPLNPEGYCERFPEFRTQIQAVFRTSPAHAPKSSTVVSMLSTSDETHSWKDARRQSAWKEGDAVGRYRLDVLIGRGSFGEVWKGFDPELNRIVAIKVPRHETLGSVDHTQRFREEARRAATLKHDGIVPVFDVGKIRSGFFIVSEFIDGPTLAQRMQSETISRSEAIRIVRTLALTLHRAHQSGLIHRDIKPSNILMRKDGTPTITDFGLAVSEEDQLNLKREFAGTYAYMSPEQARGEARLLDGRSDLYSLGVILFQLLTGRMPFQYRTIEELLEQIRDREVRPLRSIDDSIPAALDEICLKCLAKDVRNRYPTGRDLAADLANWERRKSRSSPNSFLVAGALALLGLIGFSLTFGQWRWDERKSNAVVTPPSATPPDAKPPSAMPPVHFAAGQAPASEWTAMLDQPLEPIIAYKGAPTDFLEQSTSTNSLTARSEQVFWVFASRSRGTAPLRIRGSVFTDDWVGTVGFVWGLSDPQDEFPRKPPRFYACLIERYQPTDPLRIFLSHFETQQSLPDVLSVGHRTTFAWTTIDPPTAPLASLELAIDRETVFVSIDGRVVWKPTMPEQRMSDLTTADGKVGIMLRGKTVVVRDAATRFLKLDPLKKEHPDGDSQ